MRQGLDILLEYVTPIIEYVTLGDVHFSPLLSCYSVTTWLLAPVIISYLILLSDLSIEGSLTGNPGLGTIFAGPCDGAPKSSSPSLLKKTEGSSGTTVIYWKVI